MEDCERCGRCCTNRPCPALPDDIPSIANFLNLSISDLFENFLIWDYYISKKGENFYFIAPKRKSNGKKDKISAEGWNRENSPCIFFQNKSCFIHPVKPWGGRIYSCKTNGKLNNNTGFRSMRIIAKKWRDLAKEKKINDYQQADFSLLFSRVS